MSSVGARIDQPQTEVAATPVPEPTPMEPADSKPAPTKPARNSRTRRPAPRRTRPKQPSKPEETAATGETENKPPAEISETETKTPARAKRPTRRNATARRAAKPPDIQEPEDTGPRLIIETNDGTLVDRFMNSVRRVTVENGQVVVLGKDGKIQRIPLASVVRMTISP